MFSAVSASLASSGLPGAKVRPDSKMRRRWLLIVGDRAARGWMDCSGDVGRQLGGRSPRQGEENARFGQTGEGQSGTVGEG